MGHVFETRLRRPSVAVAKERLRTLLATDRMQCGPDTYEQMCGDLFRTVSKYMKVTEDNFDVKVARSEISITVSGEET